ncbi:flavoprotein [Streptomyces gobiensis]|uniref:flavoprotein n=1 Tax=Streptomyces gobiensis TaxID=2875706 RepID=UPI001E4EBC07|nr:flavoprotein [Streptomyces gobiensis]UGY91035.1 flavoprotein [Streptomyces gobiensis]
MSRVMYLFGAAAPPVFYFADVVKRAQADGWQVCVGLTPPAACWLEERLPELEELTGHAVRSQYKLPGEPDTWPKASVIAFAPATMNSINAWALGLTSSFVVGLAAEAIGKKSPTVAMPCVNSAYAHHPQFERSVETLRNAGVTMLYGEGGFVPNQPGQGRPETYPWHLVMNAAEKALS